MRGSVNRQRLEITRLLAARDLRIRMFGSVAIDLAWVAAGRLDASIASSNHPWDMAAGVDIAREVDVRVMDTGGQSHELTSTSTVTAAPWLRRCSIFSVRAFTRPHRQSSVPTADRSTPHKQNSTSAFAPQNRGTQ
ncbi:inositol monophosphatase family protein [Streptomyces nigrescens]|uniref:inositol monophosphatase family protein n=1 Tax=Streptomyces nigrescens TaxID=1920 RepID=UPI0036FBC8C2